MATQIISHPVHGFNQHTAYPDSRNTVEALLAAHRRLAAMTATQLREDALRIASGRLRATQPVQMRDADIRVNVAGLRDPGPDYTPKAWR